MKLKIITNLQFGNQLSRIYTDLPKETTKIHRDVILIHFIFDI